MFKLLAMSLQGMPSKRNSVIFLANFWYNGVRCKGWIMILVVISDAVRIGCIRVRKFFLTKKKFTDSEASVVLRQAKQRAEES